MLAASSVGLMEVGVGGPLGAVAFAGDSEKTSHSSCEAGTAVIVTLPWPVLMPALKHIHSLRAHLSSNL